MIFAEKSTQTQDLGGQGEVRGKAEHFYKKKKKASNHLILGSLTDFWTKQKSITLS